MYPFATLYNIVNNALVFVSRRSQRNALNETLYLTWLTLKGLIFTAVSISQGFPRESILLLSIKPMSDTEPAEQHILALSDAFGNIGSISGTRPPCRENGSGVSVSKW